MIKKEFLRILNTVEEIYQDKLPEDELREILTIILDSYRLGFSEGVVESANNAASVMEDMRKNCAAVHMVVGDLENGELNPVVEQSLVTLDEFEERLAAALSAVPLLSHELN